MRAAALLLMAILVLPAWPGAALSMPLPFRVASDTAAWVDPTLDLVPADAAPQKVVLVLDPGRVAAASAALRALGLDVHVYDRLAMAAVLLPPALADHVARVPGVESIHPNERMRPLLDKSTDYVGADAVWDTYGVTGRGVTVMIMDSGVDGTHPDVAYGKALVANVVPTQQPNGLVDGSREGVVDSDADGHGTHVAGIVAGRGVGLGEELAGKYRGVAPGARLIGYKAGLIDDQGDVSFESLTVLEGFNWALANQERYGIRVLSNSWGANGDFDPRSPINIATLNLYKAGLVVLFAAGNEGEDGTHTLNKYSVAPWVLSVTAGDYLNQVPSFGSRGRSGADGGAAYDHPDLVAPGVGITSTRRVSGLSPLARATEANLYAGKTGTSMATPHVAGVAALLLEANPRLSPDDVMDILTGTATPMNGYETWEAGAGYVNGLQAYRLAKRAPGQLDEFLAGHVKYAGPASNDPDYARDAVTVGYLKGTPQRLRSPDTTLAAFAHALVSTPQGLVFLLGGLVLAALAVGPGPGDRRRILVHVPAAAHRPAEAPARPAEVGARLRVLRPPSAPATSPSTVRSAQPPRPLAPRRPLLAAAPGAPWAPKARVASARAALGNVASPMWLRPPPARPSPPHARAQHAPASAGARPPASALRGSTTRAPATASAARPSTSSLASSSRMRGRVERIEG